MDIKVEYNLSYEQKKRLEILTRKYYKLTQGDTEKVNPWRLETVFAEAVKGANEAETIEKALDTLEEIIDNCGD